MWAAWNPKDSEPEWNTISSSKVGATNQRQYFIPWGRYSFPIVQIEVREIRPARKAKAPKAKRRSRAGGSR
jgi:hypothetical protein